MRRIRQMFRCRKTSSLLKRAFLIDQVSHPHRSKFMGIAQKSKYLLQMSRWGESQTFLSTPMDWVAAVTRFSISLSLHRPKEMKEPKYLKWRQKVTYLSSTWMGCVSSYLLYSSSSCSRRGRSFSAACHLLLVSALSV
jgi:hypothetical protein